MLKMNIAGIILSIGHEDHISSAEFVDKYFSPLFQNYIADMDCEPDFTVSFRRAKRYAGTWEKHVPYSNYLLKIKENITELLFTFDDANEGLIAFKSMEIASDWKSAVLTLHDYPDYEYLGLRACIRQYFEGAIIEKGAFVQHGPAIEHDGKGIIFTADSGVGKSTHADFWVKNFGSLMLNGDSPVIKFVDGKTLIHGSPWCGSSGVSVNKAVPLNAIVIIKRGSENKIKQLKGSSIPWDLLPQMRCPLWDQGRTELAIGYLEKIISDIPVFELECLPNAASAEMSFNAIFGRQAPI